MADKNPRPIDVTQDLGLVQQNKPSRSQRATPMASSTLGATPANTSYIANPEQPVKSVTINYTDPPLYGVPQLQIFNDPGGQTNQIQFNYANTFAGDGNLTWDNTNKILRARNIQVQTLTAGVFNGLINIPLNQLHVTGGNSGQVLSTDGAGNLSWVNMSGNGSATPGGPNTSIQFNDNGSFNGISALAFDKTTDTLNTVNIAASDATIYGNVNAINVVANSLYGDGSNISNIGNVSHANTSNVANIAYHVSVSNVTGIGNISTLNLTGSSSNVLYGNGVFAPIPNVGIQSKIANGTSNVNIGTANGPITVKAGSANEWTFGTDGSLTTPNGSNIYPAGNNFNIYTQGTNGAVQFFTDSEGNSYNWSFDGYGVTSLPDTAGHTNTSVIVNYSGGNIEINANNKSFTFDITGNIVLPDSTSSINYPNGAPYGGTAGLPLANGTSNFDIEVANGNATITSNGAYTWTFDNTGNLTAPGAINVGNMSIGTLPGYITAEANIGIIFNTSGPDGGFVVDYLKEDGNANTSGGELAFSAELGNATYRISLSDDLGDGFATKIWRFDGTGNLSLPSGGSVYSEGYTPSGAPGNTIILNPHGSGSITNQKLMVYPTAGDGDHIHMTTGNLYQTELFLGSDNFFVKLANTGNVVVNTNDDLGNTAIWTFGYDGLLTLPSGNVTIGSVLGGDAILSNNAPFGVISQGNGATVVQWSDDISNTSLLSAVYVNGPFGNVGDIQVRTGNVATPNVWTFGNDGNLTLPGDTFAVNYANGTQVPLGGGSNTGNVTFSDQVVQGTGTEDGGGGLYLAPGANSTGNLQYLRVRGGDYPTHIHLDTGNNNYFDQYFGADSKYVKLEANGNVVINADNGNSATWTFDTTGNFNLAEGNSVIQSVPNNAGDGSGLSTLNLIPDNSTGDDRYLIVDPTGPNHLHLRAGGAQDASTTALYLGGEQNYVQVTDGVGLRLQNQLPNEQTNNYTDPADFTGATWFTDSGNYYIQYTSTNPQLSSDPYQDINTIYITWNSGSNDATLTYGGSTQNLGGGVFKVRVNEMPYAEPLAFTTLAYTLNVMVTNFAELDSDGFNVSVQSDVGLAGNGYIEIVNNSNSSPITIIANNSGSAKTWSFDTTGNLTLPSNTVAINFANGTAAFGNIVSVNKDGNASNVLYGNGVFASAPSGSNYGDSNVITLLSSYGSNSISTTGNITANYIIGNGSLLTGTYSNTDVANYLTSQGITNYSNSNATSLLASFGSNTITTTGNVSVGNITATNLGNLSALNKDGNAGNVLYGNGVFAAAPAGTNYGDSNVVALLTSYGSNSISTTGNVTASYFIGNGYTLTNINGANVTGTIANATYATSAGTVTTNAQPNITSVGTLTSLSVSGNANVGNLGTTGRISATGTITSGAVTYANTDGTNGQVLTTYGNGITYWSSPAGNYGNSNVVTLLGSYGSNSISTTGNVTANYFIGDGSLLTGLYSNTNVASYLSSQGITNYSNTNAASLLASFGSNSISTSGNITSGNITTGNLSVSGNISGNIVAPGSNTQVFFNDNGLANASANLTFNKSTSTLDVNGPFIAGTGTPLGGLTNPTISAATSANNYVQVDIFNANTGTQASADFIAYPDNGTDASGWVDLGITSSTFNQAAYTVTGQNESYLFASAPSGASKSGNLVIATDSTGANNSIEFYVGGFSQTKNGTGRKFLITSTAANVTGNLNVSANLAVNGGVITTTASTANIFNSTPTTVNIGNAASLAVNIGNGSGTVNLYGNVQGNTNGFAIGYRDIPQISFTGNATLALTDAGKHYYSTLSTANTLTVPNNSSVAFATGTAINVINQGSGNITIAQGVGVTMYLAGNSTSGNRTLASYGMATLQKVATDTWFIVGVGVT